MTHYSSVAPPGVVMRVLGAIVALSGLAICAVIMATEDNALIPAILGALVSAGLATLIIGFAVRVEVTSDTVVVRYGPFRRVIPVESVIDVGAGDHVNGIGYGYGLRWEGRGKWAFRVGGPMATVVTRDHRIGLSVQDPVAFVDAVVVARQAFA